MDASRLVPLVMMAVGSGVAVTKGPEMVKAVTDSVKVTLTQYELSTLRRHIMIDASLERKVPNPADPPSLGRYIRGAAVATGRDPSVDFWGHPYQMRDSDTDRYVVLSAGPNGQVDECAGVSWAKPEDDDVCVAISKK